MSTSDYATGKLNVPLFGLPNVYPLISVAFFYQAAMPNPPGFPYRSDTIENRALNFADWIEYVRNQLAIYFPGKTFRYGMGIAGVGYSLTSGVYDPANNNGLFTNSKDLLPSGKFGIYHVNGFNSYPTIFTEYIGYLSQALTSRGLPPPDFIDSDFEADVFSHSYTMIPEMQENLADSRSDTVLFDGIRTFRQLCENHIDLDGNPRNLTVNSFPEQYSVASIDGKNVGLYQTLYFSIIDYGLYLTYQPLKVIWPNCQTLNWATHNTNRNNLTYNYRYKEAPYEFNNLWLDYPSIHWYGLRLDTDNLKDYFGYNCYENFFELYNVVKTGNVTENLINLYLAESKIKCQRAIATNKAIPHYTWDWRNGNYSGDYITPSGGSIIIDTAIAKQVLKDVIDQGVETIVFFTPGANFTFNNENYKTVIEQINTELTNEQTTITTAATINLIFKKGSKIEFSTK